MKEKARTSGTYPVCFKCDKELGSSTYIDPISKLVFCSVKCLSAFFKEREDKNATK